MAGKTSQRTACERGVRGVSVGGEVNWANMCQLREVWSYQELQALSLRLRRELCWHGDDLPRPDNDSSENEEQTKQKCLL